LEPPLADQAFDQVARKEPLPAEPLAYELALRCEHGGAHGSDDEIADVARAVGGLGVRLVVTQELARVRVSAVTQAHA
jgi:hypothetical protein